MCIISATAFFVTRSLGDPQSKADAMLSIGKQIGDANIQLHNDTGCFASKPAVLFDKATASIAANNFCNRPLDGSWKGPYMAPFPIKSDGNLVANDISAEVTAALPNSINMNGRKKFFIRFNNVPKGVLKQALIECNGDIENQGDFQFDRCRTTVNLADDLPGDFEIVYSSI